MSLEPEQCVHPCVAIKTKESVLEQLMLFNRGDSKQDQPQNNRPEPDEDELENFRPLLSHLRLQSLPDLALSLKASTMSGALNNHCGIGPFTCTVHPQPLFGAFNILYKVAFSDNTTWIFKIPRVGYSIEWTEASKRRLVSEAQTMRLVRKRTNIPIPEVYAFDPSLDNDIHAPYIAMEYVQGINLFQSWYGTREGDESLSKDQLEQRRVQWLRRIAEISFEFGKLTFGKWGVLDFLAIDYDDIPEPTGSVDDDTNAEVQLQQSFEELPPILLEIGQFSDPKSYLLGHLNLHSPESSNARKDWQIILRQFVDWLPESVVDAQIGPDGHRFVLCHPDFSLQNIMISNDPDCRIVSIVDWDGVGTAPFCFGNEMYPNWITCDWAGSVIYSAEKRQAECKKKENSPEDLQRYRALYASYMQSLVGTERECFTKFSYVYGMLEAAAANMYLMGKILYKLCDKCIEASTLPGSVGEDTISVYDVLDACRQDSQTPTATAVISRLREGFLRLCEQGM